MVFEKITCRISAPQEDKMSLHVQLSSELQEKLSVHKRNTTISSLMVALLLIALIGVILFMISMALPPQEIPVLTAYKSHTPAKETTVEEKKITLKPQRKPSAPSSSMTRTIASHSASTVAIPIPDFEGEEISLDFGNNDGLEAGWGNTTADSTAEYGGGNVTFFKQKLKAERVIYIIDTSNSMSKQRKALMKSELSKSIKNLPAQIKYQIIFFSSPAWVAGSEAAVDNNSAEIKDQNGTYKWTGNVKNRQFGWEPNGKKQPVEWLDASKSNIQKSVKVIEMAQMRPGTNWYPPLTMALNTKPRPQIIYFMTDGLAGKTDESYLDPIIKVAKRRQCTINTIGLMEPRASEGLHYLAKETGGKFTIVNKDESIILLD